ncbi:MAG: replication initiation protein [Marinobacter sp.]|nr:replication initiation protein [Marinobacter sp.]
MKGKPLRVAKGNALIEASYKLSLNEQRLLLAVIARIDSRRSMREYKFSVTAHEFAETFQIELHTAYEALQDAAASLFERDIRTYDGRHRERFRWVDRISYVDGESRVELNFTIHVAAYLTQLHKEFTAYGLAQVSNLKSVYSIRVFEMLMQYRKTGWLQISLDDFRGRLMLEDAYTRFDNLKARVIKPAVSELEEKSNLNIQWRAVKNGRKIVALRFDFAESEQPDLFKESLDASG